MTNSKLTVISRETTDHFTIVGNQIARDKRVSTYARGIWFTVMTLPPDWEFTIKGLATVLGDSEYSVRRGMTSLTDSGYVTTRVLREGNRICGREYSFRHTSTDTSQGTGIQDLEIRSLGNGIQDLENYPQYKDSKNLSIKREDSTAEKISDPGQEVPKPQVPKKVKTQRSVETTIPEDFKLTDKMREWAATEVPSLDIEFETKRFIDRCEASGKLYTKWEAGWRTQMRNQVSFNAASGITPAQARTAKKPVMVHGRSLSEIMADNAPRVPA